MKTYTPYKFQEPMIDWLVERNHAALFVGMGLGKTPVTLEALRRVGGKALVVAPLRVANLVWADAVKKFGFDFKVVSLRTKEGMKAWEEGTADIYTVNFELLSRGMLDKLAGKGMPVDTLIIDELSLCKSNSNRTKSIIKARKYFTRIYGLTGTPASNSIMDLFYQLKCIDGGERLTKYITHYRQLYFDSDYLGYTYTPKTNAKAQIEKKISDICLSIRAEDHLTIPPHEVIDIDVELPAKVMKKYRELEKHLVIETNGAVIDAQSAATLINKLMQMTAGIAYDEEGEEVFLHDAKHKHLRKVLDNSMGEPVLVLTRYKSEMKALLEAFPEAEKFDENKLDDWEAGKIPVWLANPASLSHGIDRIQTSCSRIVWMSLTYSLEQYEQTNARILRTGQQKTANITRILAVDSVDWAVVTALEDKAEGQTALMKSIGVLQRANDSCPPQTPRKDSPQSCESRGLLDLFGRP